MKFLKNIARFGRRTLRSSLALLSVVGAIGRAGLRKEVGLLRPEPRGPKGASARKGTVMCRVHAVPEMVKPAMRTTAVWLGFSNLTNMFSFAMTSGLASESDEFKIIITLRRAQKVGDSGPYKNFDFCITHL